MGSIKVYKKEIHRLFVPAFLEMGAIVKALNEGYEFRDARKGSRHTKNGAKQFEEDVTQLG